MPLFDILPNFIEFFAIFAPIFAKFDLWTSHKKRKDSYIPVFPGRIKGLCCTPLNFSAEKIVDTYLIMIMSQQRRYSLLTLMYMY